MHDSTVFVEQPLRQKNSTNVYSWMTPKLPQTNWYPFREKYRIAEIDVHQSQIQLLNAQISQLQQENNAQKLHGPYHNEVQILTGKMFYFVYKIT